MSTLPPNEELIYFELNNWCSGENYPDAEPFLTWMSGYVSVFRNAEWVKGQGLAVVFYPIDISQSYLITAPKSWVEENCPELLTTYQKFLRIPDPDYDPEIPYGLGDVPFQPYDQSTIGTIQWYRDPADNDYDKPINEDDG